MELNLSDPAYALVAGSAPVSRRRELLVAGRWKQWEPWAALEAKRIAGATPYGKTDIQTVMRGHRDRHRVAILHCLRLGLSWKAIVRAELDDPRLTDRERKGRIVEALERSATTRRGHLHDKDIRGCVRKRGHSGDRT